MRHTWANAFILLLAATSLVTGYYALVAGDPSQAWQVSAHNIAGFGVVAVLVWKLPNVLRPLIRRFGAWTYQDYLALAALTLLLTDILLGIVWVHLGRFAYLGTTGLTWHVVLVFLIVPMIVWHVARYRRLLRPRYWAQRRSVLRLGGLALAGAALWQIGVRLDSATGVAKAKRFTGSYAAGDFQGNAFPTTSWLNDRLGPIDRETWTLTIAGAVDHPAVLPFSALQPTEEETAHARLHGRMAFDAALGGRAARRAHRPHPSPELRGERHGHLRDGLLPALPASARGRPAARDARRRRAAVARSRRAVAAGRAGQARLRVGEMGHADRRQHDRQLAPASAAAPVAPRSNPCESCHGSGV